MRQHAQFTRGVDITAQQIRLRQQRQLSSAQVGSQDAIDTSRCDIAHVPANGVEGQRCACCSARAVVHGSARLALRTQLSAVEGLHHEVPIGDLQRAVLHKGLGCSGQLVPRKRPAKRHLKAATCRPIAGRIARRPIRGRIQRLGTRHRHGFQCDDQAGAIVGQQHGLAGTDIAADHIGGHFSIHCVAGGGNAHLQGIELGNVGREAFTLGGVGCQVLGNQVNDSGTDDVNAVNPSLGLTLAAVQGNFAVRNLGRVVQGVEMKRAHVQARIGRRSLNVVLNVADVQTYQAGHDRALDASVFAILIALAVKAGGRDLHQACATLPLP